MKSSALFLSLVVLLSACAGAGRALDQVGENSIGAGLAAGLGAGVGLFIPGLGAAYGAALAVGGFLCSIFSRPAAQAVASGAAPVSTSSAIFRLVLVALAVLVLRSWAHSPSMLKSAWQTTKVVARGLLGGRQSPR